MDAELELGGPRGSVPPTMPPILETTPLPHRMNSVIHGIFAALNRFLIPAKEDSMKAKTWLAVVASLLLAVSWAGAEEIAGLPLHVQKLGDGMPHDFQPWLANWDRLLAEKDRITTLVPAHWNGELSVEGAEARVEYVRTLWDGVREAFEAGKSAAEVQAEYRLDTRFPELVDSPGFSQQTHYASVTELWGIRRGGHSRGPCRS